MVFEVTTASDGVHYYWLFELSSRFFLQVGHPLWRRNISPKPWHLPARLYGVMNHHFCSLNLVCTSFWMTVTVLASHDAARILTTSYVQFSLLRRNKLTDNIKNIVWGKAIQEMRGPGKNWIGTVRKCERYSRLGFEPVLICNLLPTSGQTCSLQNTNYPEYVSGSMALYSTRCSVWKHLKQELVQYGQLNVCRIEALLVGSFSRRMTQPLRTICVETSMQV